MLLGAAVRTLALVGRPTVAPLRMALDDPCPRLPEPVQSNDQWTVTLAMGYAPCG